MSFYNKIKVNSLSFDKEYSLKKQKNIINFNINGDVNINVSTLSSIRKLSNLEEIKNIICVKYIR